jgi:hypothetical protein
LKKHTTDEKSMPLFFLKKIRIRIFLDDFSMHWWQDYGNNQPFPLRSRIRNSSLFTNKGIWKCECTNLALQRQENKGYNQPSEE